MKNFFKNLLTKDNLFAIIKTEKEKERYLK